MPKLSSKLYLWQKKIQIFFFTTQNNECWKHIKIKIWYLKNERLALNIFDVSENYNITIKTKI